MGLLNDSVRHYPNELQDLSLKLLLIEWSKNVPSIFIVHTFWIEPVNSSERTQRFSY